MFEARIRKSIHVCAAAWLALAASVGACADSVDAEAPGEPRVLRKLLVDPAEADAVAEARARGTVVDVIDYGSYALYLVDERPAHGRAHRAMFGVEERDDMDRLWLEDGAIDTRTAAPAPLRGAGDGLYVVQFVGPVRDEWLAALAARGLDVVSYVPENAYVVRARGGAGAALPAIARDRFVQYVGDFLPAYKLAAAARAAAPADLLVQVVDGPDVDRDLADLGRLATTVGPARRVGRLRHVDVTLDPARLPDLLARPYVFHAEARLERRRLDEAQGQILAGNLTGNAPTGPGYRAWLEGQGFAAGQFGFAVNVVDDAWSLAGHPDLPDDRIAFALDPTEQEGVQGGHGFLNAHILAGANVEAGDAFVDALGFHYGEGIAPYARVGTTAIFGPTPASPTEWEDAAYVQGARISTNSWSLSGTAARRYDASAQEYDLLVRDAQPGTPGEQPLVVVFAAGNDGPGVNTIASPGTAKNVITVGASEGVRAGGTDGCLIGNNGASSAADVISFSSRGPVNAVGGDGRMKPDLVAPGTHVMAGIPQSDYDGSSVCDVYFPDGQTLYTWSSGTSHAAPAVAGAAALVYQDFLNQGREAPSPALVKAALMNGASYMTGVGGNTTLPAGGQGMGRVNLGRSLDDTSRWIVDQTQVLGASGQTYKVTGQITDATQPVRVTLAWSDAPGPTTGAPWVNNLDLEVKVGATTYKGNVFSGARSVAGGVGDVKNNVESVFLPAGATGPVTVTVKATNIAGDGVADNGDVTDQDFALVVYNFAKDAPVLQVSPASLSFATVAGTPAPAAQTLDVANTGTGTLAWTATSDATWLSLTPAAGAAPATIGVAVNAAGLAPGSYAATVTIIGGGDTAASPALVLVTLVVAPPPALVVSPTVFQFAGEAGGATPAEQTLTVANGGGGTLAWTATTDAIWLHVTPAAGSAPATATVTVDTAGLIPGVYSGAIVVAAEGATGAPATIPVTLTLISSTPVLVVSPTSLAFAASAGGPSPAAKSLAISNGSGGTLTWTASDDATWLSVSPTSGTGAGTVTVSVDSAGLIPGSYAAKITVAAPGATGAPAQIPVTLAVSGPPGELIVNGGFENGTAPWVLSGNMQTSTTTPRSGTAALVSTTSTLPFPFPTTSGTAYQTVTIPATVTQADLSFYLRIDTLETEAVAYDFFHVEVVSPSTGVVTTLAKLSNLDATGTYVLRGPFNLLPWKGQTIRVQVYAGNDGSYATTFRVDDVSLK